MLDQHDEINMSSVKEPSFYLAELKRQKLLQNYTEDQKADLNNFISSGNYRTRSKYNSLFDKTRTYKYRGESSHYIYSPGVANIIKKESPNSKIIISIRNPISRLYSEFCTNERRNTSLSHNFNSFVNECIKKQKENIISKLNKGLFFSPISHYIKVFGAENVKIIVYEEFKENQQKVLSDIFKWLNLNDLRITNLRPQKTGKIRFKKVFHFINSNEIIKNSLKYILSKKTRIKIRSFFYDIFIENKQEYSEISTTTRNLLVDFYKEDVIKLERLLKKRLYF
jgi:hypothetical protein